MVLDTPADLVVYVFYMGGKDTMVLAKLASEATVANFQQWITKGSKIDGLVFGTNNKHLGSFAEKFVKR